MYRKFQNFPIFMNSAIDGLFSSFTPIYFDQLDNAYVEKPLYAVINGTSGDDVLTGTAGDDTIYAGDGDDTLYVTTGNDSLYGQGGTDTFVFDGSGETGIVSYNDSNERLTYGSNVTTTSGIENFHLTGGSGNDYFRTSYWGLGDDVLVGNDGDDTIISLGGDDSLDGGSGNDSLDGGDGNDTLNGGAGVDTLSGADGNDMLDGGTENDLLYAGTGDDILIGGAGDDVLFAGDGIDDLTGGAGNDRLYGQAGTNNLYGGAGDDNYYGGSGVDTYQFNATDGAATERVSYFTTADIIQLNGFGFADAAAAASSFVQSGGNVVFNSGGVQIVFYGATLADVQGAVQVDGMAELPSVDKHIVSETPELPQDAIADFLDTASIFAGEDAKIDDGYDGYLLATDLIDGHGFDLM